jgi:hypothetical protein
MYESREGKRRGLAGAVRSPGAAPRAATTTSRRHPLRFVWKTIKWVVITIVLLVTAIVVVVIVALVHAGQKAESRDNQARESSRVARRDYPRIKTGMTAGQVRRIVGKPTDVQRYSIGGRETCWYYGSILVGENPYEFWFRENRLVSKGRLT